VAAIEDREYDIVGDLAELVPDTVPPDGPQPDDVRDDEVAAAAVETIASLVARLRRDDDGA
jgi:hypothetical protein